MNVEVQAVSPEEVEADVLAVPLTSGNGLAGAAGALDSALDGLLQRLSADGELRDEPGRVRIVHVDGKLGTSRLAVVGVGSADKVDADALRTAAALVAEEVGDFAEHLAWVVDDSLPPDAAEQVRALVDGTLLGSYHPARWKSDDSASKLSTLVLCGSAKGLAASADRAALVAEWTNRARDLVNSPPNEMNPERLAERAREIASSVEHLTAEALGPDEIKAQGMGALAAVAQGSDTPPRLVVLRYDPPEPTHPELVLGLVGKAITFDTGGISLKPSLHMEDMKGDMAGGAAVIEATGAIAELGLPIRVLTVAAASENMPGGHAYRPGDIITAANGKTIEVTNTDAEGRLILADALTHARREGATHILDLATLTGAIVIAMGDYYAGLFANDQAWAEEIRAAAEESGDHAWIMPLHETYKRYIESPYADMKNSSEYRQGSPILAARFLQEFVGEGPWAHLDIAGTAYLERSREDYYGAPGATGYGVRLLAELARRFS